MFDGSRFGVESPFSGQSAAIEERYLSEEDLRSQGAHLAGSGTATLPGYEPFDFALRQRKNLETIAETYRASFRAAEAGDLITPAAEWLLDNFYRMEETARQVKRDLPRPFYRSLPVMPAEAGGHVPRVLALAWIYAAHSRCEVTRERLTALVEGYQDVRPLAIGELWALPSMLRFVMIDDLARLARRIEMARAMRGRANAFADQLLATESAEARQALLRDNEINAADDAFASQLLYRLSEGPVRGHDAIIWLEAHLEARGSDAEEVLIADQNRLSAGNARIRNIVRGLRTLDDIDWRKWFTSVSRVDALLRSGSNFDALDFTSRDQYRGAIEQMARWSGKEELAVARTALDSAATAGLDVGFFLTGPRRAALETLLGCRPPIAARFSRLYRGFGWLGIAAPIVVLTLVFTAMVFTLLAGAGAGIPTALLLALLALLPASEAATALFNTLVTAILPPTRLIGFEYEEGVPESGRTLVVVPCLIDSHDTIDELIRGLEVHYLSHTRGELYFALLSDWPDAAQERSGRDDELLDYARAEIARLARLYAHDGKTRFFLLHRVRLYNPAEGAWMGWERKRGKLLELGAVLRGEPDTTFLPFDTPLPDGIDYVMTLDSDTRLTRDAVTKLVGKLAHPLNRPVADPATGRVTQGYGVLQPRVTASLTTGAQASAFQRIFSINRGLDPYVFTVSDVYQDLTGEGTFTGKGLYHVDTFHAVLADSFAENTVLSHDLLEGVIARAALVSDVEVVEDFPVRYEVESSRQHRWARGDWQLLPYFRAHGVNALGRWKMLDNLRRSIVPIAWTAASITGWCLLAPTSVLWFQAGLVLSLVVGPVLALSRQLRPTGGDGVLQAEVHAWFREAGGALSQVGLRLIFMAHNAALMSDAIVRTLYRLTVSRRNLLEWRSAAVVAARGYRGPLDYARAMLPAIGIGAAAIALPLLATRFGGGGGAGVGIAFGLLWIASPLVAWRVSGTAETEDRLRVSPAERDALRRVARRTWTYFDHFVTAEHNWLPPDNYQEIPHPVVANRTSPTNIGCYLLSVLSARDFGWISLTETVGRLENTLRTLDGLPKHRGHIFNWYETRTLAALEPRYVSTVDSGNLAGHLVALSSACRDWAEAPFAYLRIGLAGIRDTLGVLTEELATVPDDRRAFRPLRRRLEERLAGFDRAVTELETHPEFTSVRILNLSIIANELTTLARELDHELKTDQTRSVVRWALALHRTCEANFADATLDTAAVEALGRRLAALRDLSRDLAFSMDFGFLLNRTRRLLSIGYRVDGDELDESCYDLLASEARLTSFFGIAKGDLPTEHWFHLGRPIVPVDSLGALLSWSGSMFEYLMPPLVMQERQGGILNQTNMLIVKRQIDYGRRMGIPWGISEAAFNARDPEMTYQYQNFGVPSLGMKRGLAKDLVVAPYATLLASQFQPAAALRNLATFRSMGALGEFGFYDSVDFTAARLPENAGHAVVRNVMAHHAGMSILAVSNVAFQGRLRERFHSDPVIEAAELLLQEKAPRTVPMLTARVGAEPVSGRSEAPAAENRVIADPTTADRATALLSNGHYSLTVTARGTGGASWNGLAVTRWRPDPTEDRWGNFIFLRDAQSAVWWSTTTEPRAAEGETSRAIFSDSKAEFHKTAHGIRSQVDVIIANAHDAEGRRVTLENTSTRERLIEVTSYAEPVLARMDSDAAHPVFSRMFLRTEIDEGGAVIHVARNPRGPGEPDMRVAHMVVSDSTAFGAIQAETDRRAFIGRGRVLGAAAAFDRGARLSGSAGFTLDPVMSLRRTLRIAPGKKASVTFWTIAAPDRDGIDAALRHLAHPESFEHSATQAWTRSQIQQFQLGMSPEEATIFQRLGRYLVYPDTRLRAEAGPDAAAPQSALWPLRISGDFPIMLLRIDAEADLAIARKALRAQEYFRARGLHCDLVIINEHASSYSQDLQNVIDGMCENARLRGLIGGPREHIFALSRDRIDDPTYHALLAAARVVFHARNGKFSTQIERAEALAEAATPPEPKTKSPRRPAIPLLASPAPRPAEGTDGSGLDFWNGFGGFAPDGRAYVIRLAPGQSTPQPWINVISNGAFGFHVSAEGGGFTWSTNSRDYQLTPWSNDPVTDRPGEGFFVVDRDTFEVFTPFAGAATDPAARFEARHGMGHSRFQARFPDIDLTLTQTAHVSEAVKLSQLRLTNRSRTARRLRIYGYAEWVLGNNRDKTAPFITSTFDAAAQALIARNSHGIDYRGRAAFFACSAPTSTVTSSRGEFLGTGSTRHPEAVAAARALSGDLSPTGDPCAALATDLTLAPGESRDLLFLLGDAASPAEAAALAARHRGADFNLALAAVSEEWRGFLDVLRVQTPDPAFDILLNGWLPYQTLACRLRARAAFYQASGAFGFRDQLQDTLSLLLHAPQLARAQILNAASRQFPEGDVQHWWLPTTGAGVRTLISDDIVWLTYAVTQYTATTGDFALLDETRPFLTGPALEQGKHNDFFLPEPSDEQATVYEHCARGLDLALQRTGQNGLALMLGGDWNDGMDRVGIEGRGESIWLSWFLARALDDFIPIAEARGDITRAQTYRAHRAHLAQAIETAGWDGANYRRGYFDDGSALGSTSSDECQIDSIAQSWAVLSGVGDPARADQAMDRVLDTLVDNPARLVRLFTPPFEHTPRDPGYIKGYPPGVRENGGQYTHAATWVVYALARMGRADQAYRLFDMLNPITHSRDAAAAETYRVEPYVVAADVYSIGEKRGRGGWTWYTGSSGWLYRTAVEAILGITRRGDRLRIEPALPAHWPGFTAQLTLDGAVLAIAVTRAGADYAVTINGAPLTDPEGYSLPGAR